MGVITSNEQQESAQTGEPCPECAFDGTVEFFKDFDDSPLPAGDSRSFEELCQVPFAAPAEPRQCPRCGGPMPIKVIEMRLHPACRHPEWDKRTGRGEVEATEAP